MTISFETHPSLPNRIVALSEGGSHLALIINRNNGNHFEVKPHVNWIERQMFNKLEHAQSYILSITDRK